MESALQLLADANVATLTLFGMGGVFFALVLLFFFIRILVSLSERQPLARLPSAVPVSLEQARNSEPSSDPTKKKRQELAAVVAVAMACALREQAESSNAANPWQFAGRLDLMRPFSPVKKRETTGKNRWR
jgi:Na+-transporting methylmalonyl-CoA/oxaloacetate decarboxylase gamma subunit